MIAPWIANFVVLYRVIPAKAGGGAAAAKRVSEIPKCVCIVLALLLMKWFTYLPRFISAAVDSKAIIMCFMRTE